MIPVRLLTINKEYYQINLTNVAHEIFFQYHATLTSSEGKLFHANESSELSLGSKVYFIDGKNGIKLVTNIASMAVQNFKC